MEEGKVMGMRRCPVKMYAWTTGPLIQYHFPIISFSYNICDLLLSMSLTLFIDGGGKSECAPGHSHCPHGGGRAGLEAR